MAFETLKPHRELIETAKRDGKSLAEIVDVLAAKNVTTTPGTLSRYLKEIGSPFRPRELTATEKPLVDQTVLLTEIFAEVQGAKEEQRAVIEKLTAKVAVLTATIEEFEKTSQRTQAMPIATGSMDSRVVRRVWARAFLISAVISGTAATAAVAKALGWM